MYLEISTSFFLAATIHLSFLALSKTNAIKKGYLMDFCVFICVG